MSMQRGFGATADVAPAPMQDILSGTGVFHISNKEGQNRRTTVLLDDEPLWGYRHKIKREFNPVAPSKDWKERDIRVTCRVEHDKHDRPRECMICEAAIRAPDVIKRVFTANLTTIDIGEHRTKKGQVYHDLKKLLELDWEAYEAFREQKKAMGSLVGCIFSVIRPTGDPKRSKTFGIWTATQQRVNLMQHFFGSPAVRNIMETAAKRGERITQQEAVQRLVSPIDYEKELNNYSPEVAERFIIRATAKSYTASEGEGGGFQGSSGFQASGGGGFGGAPTMPPHAAPDYSVGPQAGQQPPAQHYPQQGFAPVPTPGFQPAPMQAPMGPPQVGNPVGATMPAAWSAPQPPQGFPPPAAASMQGMQQPWGAPQPQGFPAQQPQPTQPPGGGYSFDAAPGWQSAFPGGQQPQGFPTQPQGFPAPGAFPAPNAAAPFANGSVPPPPSQPAPGYMPQGAPMGFAPPAPSPGFLASQPKLPF
jgi:hypothetical protein